MENKDRKHYEIALLLITFGVGAVLASRYLKAQELALGMMTDEQPPADELGWGGGGGGGGGGYTGGTTTVAGVTVPEGTTVVVVPTLQSLYEPHAPRFNPDLLRNPAPAPGTTPTAGMTQNIADAPYTPQDTRPGGTSTTGTGTGSTTSGTGNTNTGTMTGAGGTTTDLNATPSPGMNTGDVVASDTGIATTQNPLGCTVGKIFGARGFGEGRWYSVNELLGVKI